MEEIVKVVLLVFVVLFLTSITYLVLSVKKKTGTFPIIRNTNNIVYDFVGKIVLLTYFLIILNVLFFIFDISFPEIVTNIHLDFFGLFVVGLSLICMFVSQMQMRKSWRIGIDKKSKIELVDCGFFKVFRHPIYFFAVVLGVGLVFVINNIVSIFLAFLLWQILSLQSRLEEEFMSSKFGKDYKKFLQTRKRWF